MRFTPQAYQRVATVLWLLVGVSGGSLLTSMLGWSGRMGLFWPVALAGGILLWRYHSVHKLSTAAPRQLVEGEVVPTLPEKTESVTSSPEPVASESTPVTTAQAKPQPSTPLSFEEALFSSYSQSSLESEERREWLDELLVKQQNRGAPVDK